MDDAMEALGAKRKGVIKKLLNIITVFFAVLCIGLLVSARLSKNGSFIPGVRSFIVMTGSMSPTFEAGSYIIVKEKNPESIQVGDIITYKVDANTTLTHRVVELMKEGEVHSFRTQGDANNTPDVRLVTQDKVFGVAVFWINGLGSLLIALRQPGNLVAAFMILCAVLLIPELYQMVKKKIM